MYQESNNYILKNGPTKWSDCICYNAHVQHVADTGEQGRFAPQQNVTYRDIHGTNTQLSRDMTFQIYTQLEGTLTNG